MWTPIVHTNYCDHSWCSCKFLARPQEKILCSHRPEHLLSAQVPWPCQVRITRHGGKELCFALCMFMHVCCGHDAALPGVQVPWLCQVHITRHGGKELCSVLCVFMHVYCGHDACVYVIICTINGNVKFKSVHLISLHMIQMEYIDYTCMQLLAGNGGDIEMKCLAGCDVLL